MMRAILLILILAVVAIIVVIATGLLDIRQTRPAEVPAIERTESGVAARGGQAPAFDVETGSITVGVREQNVTVPAPSVAINPADSGNESGNQSDSRTPAR